MGPWKDTAIDERAKYVAMWGFEQYRAYSPGDRFLDEATGKLIKPGSSVIDFGCGTGRAAARLAELGCQVLGIDIAENCLDKNVHIPLLVADLAELPTLSADCGYCCDVMEHIATELVDNVLQGIARSVKAAFFSIALHPDASGLLIGEKLHLTVQPATWWIERLKQPFHSVEYDDRSYSLIAICHSK